MNSYPNLKLCAIAIALLALAVVLTGCNGYPKYNPETCSTVEYGDVSPIAWECV